MGWRICVGWGAQGAGTIPLRQRGRACFATNLTLLARAFKFFACENACVTASKTRQRAMRDCLRLGACFKLRDKLVCAVSLNVLARVRVIATGTSPACLREATCQCAV